MPLPGPRLYSATGRKNNLLARYSETLGELMLRKHTETAIRAARQEAELNSRSKSAFLSAMSHELRTPLNAIIGFSDLMQKPGATSPTQSAEYAGHIAKAGRRLLAVVSDVLDISRLESGSLTLTCAPAAIGDVLRAAIETMQPQFAAKKQQIDLRLSPGLGEIEIDHMRIRQLLLCLLSNASKFSGENERVVVLARPVADGGISVAVADTGVGMSHEEIMLALRPFAQIDARRARAQEGAGLGLPLALGLAKLHGGSLHIESKAGAGTTVMLTLPRRIAAPCKAKRSVQGKAA